MLKKKPCRNGTKYIKKTGLEVKSIFVGCFFVCLFCFKPIDIAGKVFRNTVKILKEVCTETLYLPHPPFISVALNET